MSKSALISLAMIFSRSRGVSVVGSRFCMDTPGIFSMMINRTSLKLATPSLLMGLLIVQEP
jgi:hypothetical protein